MDRRSFFKRTTTALAAPFLIHWKAPEVPIVEKQDPEVPQKDPRYEKTGRPYVQLDGVNISNCVREITARMSREVIDITNLGSDGYREYMPAPLPATGNIHLRHYPIGGLSNLDVGTWHMLCMQAEGLTYSIKCMLQDQVISHSPDAYTIVDSDFWFNEMGCEITSHYDPPVTGNMDPDVLG